MLMIFSQKRGKSCAAINLNTLFSGKGVIMKLAKCALLLALAIPQLALAHQAGDFCARR